MTSLVIIGAKYLIAAPCLIVLYLIMKAQGRARVRIIILTLLSFVVAYVIAKIAGHFYFNARPFVVENIAPLVPHAPDNGFPSDHSLLAGTLAMIALVANKRLGAIAWVCAFLVGISRIFAHVHHPIDVLGSFLIAACAVSCVAWILGKYRYFQKATHHLG